MKIYAHCDRSGIIEFSKSQAISGLVCLCWGEDKNLIDVVGVLSRHAYDNKTLLVPGIPEADSDAEAFQAAARFMERLSERGLET
jgi:hypothetical protein